jgi:hypothetical protein
VRLFVTDLRKLVRRPASLISLGLLIGLMALIILAVSATARQIPADQGGGETALLLVTFPGAYTLIVSFILGLGGLFGVIYGAAVAGSEWTWGTLKSAVARGESRSRYQLSLFAAVALLAGIGLLVAFLVGIGLALVGAIIADVPTDGLGDAAVLQTLPEMLGRGWLAVAEETAIGSPLPRWHAASSPIGAGIGVFFAENFGQLFLPDIVKYMPFNSAGAVVAVSETGLAVGRASSRNSCRTRRSSSSPPGWLDRCS